MRSATTRLLATALVLLALAGLSQAAVVDISGTINIDSTVGAGNSGRLVGDTQTVWNSYNVTVPIDLNGFELWADSGGGNPLDVASPISANGTFNFIGGQWWGGNWNAPIFVSGSAGNTYTGATNVFGGRTVMNKTGGDALLGTITVGDTTTQQNSSGNARLEWDADNQVSDLSDVTVLPSLYPNYSGNTDNNTYLVLNGFSDTFNSLTLMGDAQVRTDGGAGNSGSLVVNALTYIDAAGSPTSYGPGTYTANDASFIVGGGSITVGSTAAVPEPATVVLLGLGGLGLLLARRRRG